MPSAPAPETDLTRIFPELGHLRDDAKAAKVPSVLLALASLQKHDEQSLAVASDVLSEVDGLEAMLERHLDSVSDDHIARTLLAHRLITRGWSIRGRGPFDSVAAHHMEQFHALLMKAEAHLIRVCAVVPDFALAWHLRLMTARGLELGGSELRRRYARLAHHHPHHMAAQIQLVQGLCPKWGGSWPDAHDFARSASAAAPEGSSSIAVVGYAHMEHVLAIEARERRNYLVEHRAELHEASQRIIGGDHAPKFEEVLVHTMFGTLFALAGEKHLAAAHFARLGNAVDEDVWRVLGDARATVNRVRSRAQVGQP